MPRGGSICGGWVEVLVQMADAKLH
jgi:hypothetical protein